MCVSDKVTHILMTFIYILSNRFPTVFTPHTLNRILYGLFNILNTWKFLPTFPPGDYFFLFFGRISDFLCYLPTPITGNFTPVLMIYVNIFRKIKKFM